MKRRPFFVVNPKSAGGRTARDWPAMRERLRRALGDTGEAMTEAAGDGTRLARHALENGYDLVVSVGGDGTNHEVVNGLFKDGGAAIRPDACFGFITRGTGGDFRRTLKMGTSFEEALAALTSPAEQTIDVGRLTYTDHQGEQRNRHFLNIASFGIGGVFDRLLNNSPKILPGRFATSWAALKAILIYRNQPVRVSFDGQPEERITINNVAVANGQYYGGGMRVAPDARLDDGLFDVVVFGEFGRWESIAHSSKLYKGTHLTLPKVRHLRARTVEATSDGEVLLDVDGEQPGRLPATFSIVASGLCLKVR